MNRNKLKSVIFDAGFIDFEDLLFLMILIIVPTIVFRNLLLPGFESYRDFISPASWMNITNFEYNNFQYLNVLNTTNVLNFYFYFNAILTFFLVHMDFIYQLFFQRFSYLFQFICLQDI